MGLKKIRARVAELEKVVEQLKEQIKEQDEKIADLTYKEQEPEKTTTNRILDEWLNGATESK